VVDGLDDAVVILDVEFGSRLDELMPVLTPYALAS
jgi:hypothetical protein